MNIDIDIFDFHENKANNKSIKKPLKYDTIGHIGKNDVVVYIDKEVYYNIEKYSSNNTSIEVGGILLGEYEKNFEKYYVVISDFIEAKYTDASAATLKFTHKSWQYIHSEHEKRCNDTRIIGWQHTHPGYGIFLSSYDIFIHQNFFNLDFQIAYVVDPVSNIRGFFQWKNNCIEKLDGFYIY